MSEQLKEKLHNFEVTPPPGTWQEIARKIRESNDSFLLAEKMYNYEVPPPAGIMAEVLKAFTSHQQQNGRLHTSAIPKRIPHLIAAASIFGIVLMSSLYLFYNNSPKKLVADSQKNTEKKNNKEKELPDTAKESLAELTTPGSEQSTSVGAIASVYSNQREKKNYNRGTSRDLYRTIVKIANNLSAAEPISISAKPIRNKFGDIIQDPRLITSPGQKYISITGPNGQQTRISSKFMNLLLYMNDQSDIEDFDGYFDKTFLESLIWKSRFKDWREKIMQTSFIPTSTNFMDILEFKDLIAKDIQN
jgi:hypothetical protein